MQPLITAATALASIKQRYAWTEQRAMCEEKQLQWLSMLPINQIYQIPMCPASTC